MNHSIFTEESMNYELYPLITKEEQLAIFQEARGMFEGRSEELISELETIKEEFDRDLPAISA